jgi:hypothetical protein
MTEAPPVARSVQRLVARLGVGVVRVVLVLQALVLELVVGVQLLVVQRMVARLPLVVEPLALHVLRQDEAARRALLREEQPRPLRGWGARGAAVRIHQERPLILLLPRRLLLSNRTGRSVAS